MNSLSWLLWVAELSDKLSVMAVIAGLFAAAGGLITTLLANFGDGFDAEERAHIWKFARRAWIVAGIACSLLLLAPSKTTLLAIAASEIGHSVIETPEAKEIKNEALRALRDWLKSHQAKEKS